VELYVNLTYLRTRNLSDVAIAAEAAGFHGVMVTDHMLIPRALGGPFQSHAEPPPADADFPDPWVAIAGMAARTRTLRFLSGIYVAPLRPPAQVAKAVATAAVLSRGRVAVGLGLGWIRAEYEHAGQPFEDRAERLDEMVEILPRLWTGSWVEHHGEHYDFGPIRVLPAPELGIPLLAGGDRPGGLRRAARLDGWISGNYGARYGHDELKAHIDRLAELRAAAGTAGRSPWEIVVCAPYALAPEECHRLAGLGVTGVAVQPWETQPRRRADPGLDAVRAAIEAYRERLRAGGVA
jgi:probable F420-dependent oxidoreductase